MQIKLYFFILSIIITPLFSSLAFQGFTGLINTPNAQTIRDGNGIIQYNNQFDTHIVNYNLTRKRKEQTYNFGIGFLSNFEVIGRLTNIGESIGRDTILRDLSANIKFRFPFSYKYLPNIAIGIQDLGGAANNYDNKYIVIDKQISIFRPSIGYGKAGGTGRSNRMDGIFGGVETNILDWLNLILEYDGKEKHTGIRFKIPNNWFSNINLDAIFSYNIDSKLTSFGINISLPLFHKSKKRNTEDKKYMKNLKNKYKESLSTGSILSLQNKLVNFGFENVRIGEEKGKIYLEFENAIFNHNDLDAFAYVLGSISDENLDFEDFKIVLLKNNLKIFSISGSINKFREYLKEPNKKNREILQQNLSFSRDINSFGIKYITKKENRSFLIPRLEISPSLPSTIGTEVGVFDYRLTSNFRLYTNIYDGLTASLLYKIPLDTSTNFKEGKIFYSKAKSKNRLSNLMLNQTLHYKSFINTLSYGKYQEDYTAIINQTNFTTLNGNHSFALKLGNFKYKGNTKNVNLGSYRYLYSPLDIYSEVTYGKYFNEDVGVIVELKRFFGEVYVSLLYQDTKDKSNNRERFAGIKFSVPLTFRKIPKSRKYGQILGKKDFSYGIRTTILREDGTNTLNGRGAIIPRTTIPIRTQYLNRDRLSSSYILNHIDRMREAYILYAD